MYLPISLACKILASDIHWQSKRTDHIDDSDEESLPVLLRFYTFHACNNSYFFKH